MIKEARLYETIDKNEVHCYLCSHHCKISVDQRGFCGVRENKDGKLNTLVYADPIALAVDPIEKKPLFNFLPGSLSYSIATKGCNFRCGFCQNWQISQDRDIGLSKSEIMPEAIVSEAKQNKCDSIAYTYTEPTIFFEYAYDTARLANSQGIKNVFVTNGYMTKEALNTISPYLDALNIDLKSFREEFYSKNCQGHLKPVLDSIKYAKELGIWVEITTLLIPGQNDSKEELTDIAKFIADIGQEVPWHISRFHPDYNFLDYESTPLDKLKEAKNIGEKVGLRYIYLGNIPAAADTYCPYCRELLLERTHFRVEKNNLEAGKCKFCKKLIDGVYK